MSRPDVDKYFMDIVDIVSTRGTCARRKVGAVLVNHKKQMISAGYNGTYAGSPHCIDTPCPGALFKSGDGLDKCEAIHAEQNALLQCMDVYKIYTAYTSCSPCIHCVKLLLNTSCERIVFKEVYPNSVDSRRLWEGAGRQWIHFTSK